MDADKPDSNESLSIHVIDLAPTADVVSGDDETWRDAIALAKSDQTVHVSLTSATSVDGVLVEMRKREGEWIVEAPDTEANRVALSEAGRAFTVQGWPEDGRLFCSSFDPMIIEKDETAKPRDVTIIAKAEELRYVLGVVLEPETVDSQNDIYSEDEVRKAAWGYMEKFQRMGLQHSEAADGLIVIVESWRTPYEMTIGEQTVKKGTWLLGAIVKDDELWSGVKSGAFTGWSIGGNAVRRPDSEPSTD